MFVVHSATPFAARTSKSYGKRMHELVNDLIDLHEHSNEIDYTVASCKQKMRVTGKNGLSPYANQEKELL